MACLVDPPAVAAPFLLLLGSYSFYHVSLLTGLAGMGADGLLLFYPAEHYPAELLLRGHVALLVDAIATGWRSMSSRVSQSAFPTTRTGFGAQFVGPSPLSRSC